MTTAELEALQEADQTSTVPTSSYVKSYLEAEEQKKKGFNSENSDFSKEDNNLEHEEEDLENEEDIQDENLSN